MNINIVDEFVQSFFSYIKEKIVGSVRNMQGQWILGVTGPTGQVTFWVSIEACKSRPNSEGGEF